MWEGQEASWLFRTSDYNPLAADRGQINLVIVWIIKTHITHFGLYIPKYSNAAWIMSYFDIFDWVPIKGLKS